MKSSFPPSRNVRTLASIGVLILTSWGCQKKSRPPDVSPPASDGSADTSRAAIIRQAEDSYQYGPERAPVATTDPAFPGQHVPDGSIPRMTIATATLKPDVRRPSARIIARIRSAQPYAPLGIVAGDNYIWRSSWDTTKATTWVTQIIPGDRAAASHGLVRDPRRLEYSHGDPREPRLVLVTVSSVGLAFCFDDPVCGTGHCGYY
jgi:hypothetical protein